MARLVVLSLLLFAGICLASERIVGGNPTTIESYPAIVQVEFLGINSGTWSQSCGANVLNSMFVLSAAHCFEGTYYEPSARRIRAGTTYRNSGGVLVNVAQEFNHPSFGTEGLGLDGDISVVRLTTPLPLGALIKQAFIIAPGAVIPDNVPVVFAGWGDTQSGGPSSPVLLDVQVYTINRDLCSEMYESLPPLPITENMICAGVLDVGGRDACNGDSGGPMYFDNILVGVVSWGLGCANASFPGVSAAVSSYTNWIVETAVL